MSVSTEALHQLLASRGVLVSKTWLDQCLQYMKGQGPVPNTLTPLADKVFSQYLDCDIFESVDLLAPAGSAVIPYDLAMWHKHYFSPNRAVILQVMEAVDVAIPLRPADPDQTELVAAAGTGSGVVEHTSSIGRRMLKLFLTDGRNHCVGLEISPCKNLPTDIQAGCKISIQNAYVRRGVLMLHPNCAKLLGGQVDSLVALQETYAPARTDSNTKDIGVQPQQLPTQPQTLRQPHQPSQPPLPQQQRNYQQHHQEQPRYQSQPAYLQPQPQPAHQQPPRQNPPAVLDLTTETESELWAETDFELPQPPSEPHRGQVLRTNNDTQIAPSNAPATLPSLATHASEHATLLATAELTDTAQQQFQMISGQRLTFLDTVRQSLQPQQLRTHPTPTDHAQQLSVPSLVRAVCRGLARFKIVSNKYDVHLMLDDGRQSIGTSAGEPTAAYTVVIAADALCADFLGMTATDCAALVEPSESMPAATAKEARRQLMLRFAHLHGIFELVPTEAWDAVQAENISGAASGGRSSEGKGKSKKKSPERPPLLAARVLGSEEILQVLQRQLDVLSATQIP